MSEIISYSRHGDLPLIFHSIPNSGRLRKRTITCAKALKPFRREANLCCALPKDLRKGCDEPQQALWRVPAVRSS